MLRKQKKRCSNEAPIRGVQSGDVNEDIDLEITVLDLIERLNEDEKSVIILRFYEGLTIKEVSKSLDIPLGTAKTILYRALDKLRKKLKGDGVYEQ